MSGSRSGTSSTNTTRQNTSNEQVNLSDFEGIGVAADGNVDIEVTDGGAIEAMGRTAADAILAGERTAELAEHINATSLDFAADVLDGSHAISRDAMEAVGATSETAIDAVGDAGARALEFGGSLFDSALSAVSGLVDKVTSGTQETLGSTVGALQQISKEQNTSLEARNQKMVQVVIFAVLALAAFQTWQRG